MKTKNISPIIAIASVSLIGIIITQLYWVNKAYFLKEEQFNNSITIILKSISNQLQMRYPYSHSDAGKGKSWDYIPEVKNIDPEIFFRIVEEEFACFRIYDGYAFGIVDKEKKALVTGRSDGLEEELINSTHQIPLTGFRESHRFVIATFLPRQSQIIILEMLLWLLLSAVFTVITILAFYLTIKFFIKQKKLSEMKSDFFNNMTHELKTPISTISLASEMLMRENVYSDPLKTKRYANVIYDENSRLQEQVDQVLNMALIDKESMEFKEKEIDIHQLIVKRVSHFNLIVKKRKGNISAILYAKNHLIKGDYNHMGNVISNLLDNANKYSRERPDIKVTTRNVGQKIMISVEDKGIGISPENQKMIFRRLYRVPTGNIQDTRGFGLGLFYVKTIIEAHQGEINVSSELGKGSRFDIYLPCLSNTKTEGAENEN